MSIPRLSWNMDEDGVISVSATDDSGRMYALLDIFRRPMIERGAMTREEARSFQIFAAERICNAWNTDKSASQIAMDHKIDPDLDGAEGLTQWGEGHNAACEQIAYELFRRFKF